MAAIAEEDTDIQINLDNSEDNYIYYSICEYSKLIIDTAYDTIKNFCPKESNKRSRTEIIYPLPNPTFKELQASTLTRSDTVILPTTTPSIKRINSKNLSGFLNKTIPEKYKIKDLNRDIILKLQGESENTKRTMSANSAQIPEITISEITIPEIKESEKVLDCVNYGGRFLVVLDIPNDNDTHQIIFNGRGKWCPNGGIGPGYPEAKKCPFYKSTGTSNSSIDANFPNMWFPFFRIKTKNPNETSPTGRGWIYKAWGLQSVTQLRQRLYKNFNIPLQESGKELTSDFLYCFLEKFSHWWQIQLSLQLPIDSNTLWDISPILQKLKNIVLTYDYDHFRNDQDCFIKREVPLILIKYNLQSEPIHNYEKQPKANGSDKIPETINNWLRGGVQTSDGVVTYPNGIYPLCIEDNEDN